MENKKKKGFTLIELLAIIVILAIIAVITVPIILSIIDEAKKGAAKDSAYGYKDAINKYYLGRLSQDSSYSIPNGTYTINAATGYLEGNETLEVLVSGTKPSGGSVQIEENAITFACLQFDEYKTMISDGNIGEITKGECDTITLAAQTIIGKSITESDLAEYSDKSTLKFPVAINHPEITKSNIASLTEDNEVTDTATGSTIPALTSYRYMGADPDNYIYFNCNTYAEAEQNKNTCEVWRILSVENNKLKITTADTIGAMPWDDGSNHNGTIINDWSTSGLNTFLNGYYLNNGIVINYKKNVKEINVLMKNYLFNYAISASASASGSGSTLGKTNSYLNSATSSLISTSRWYVGAIPFIGTNDISQRYYAYERGNLKSMDGIKTSIDSKIAIISTSDYRYSSSDCYNRIVDNANSKSCADSNWLNNGYNQFALQPYYQYYNGQMYIDMVERIVGGYENIVSNTAQGNCTYEGCTPYGVRPVVYLTPNITIKGTGTSSDPYKIIR